jgi:hypothetical protein
MPRLNRGVRRPSESRDIYKRVAAIARELGWNLPDADLIEFGARIYAAAESESNIIASKALEEIRRLTAETVRPRG